MDLELCDNTGVSEVVGALLLLLLVVIGIGGISVILFSQPLPEEAPNADIVITRTGSEVFLTHNGGDELSKGTLEVRFDGRPVEMEFVDGGDWPWSMGETLCVTGETLPESVTVISTAGSGSIIKSSYLTGRGIEPGGPDRVPEAIPSIPPGQDPGVILEEGYKEYYLEKLKDGSVYFYRPGWFTSGGGSWDTYVTGMLSFRITGSDSYLITDGGERHTLNKNDVVKIESLYSYHQFDQELRIFMISGGGWQVRAVPESAFTVMINDIPIDGELSDSWITGSDDFESTLDLISGSGAYLGDSYTKLVINDEVKMDGNDGSQYMLSDIRPALPELMLLDLSADGSVFFMGSASEVQNETGVIWSQE